MNCISLPLQIVFAQEGCLPFSTMGYYGFEDYLPSISGNFSILPAGHGWSAYYNSGPSGYAYVVKTQTAEWGGNAAAVGSVYLVLQQLVSINRSVSNLKAGSMCYLTWQEQSRLPATNNPPNNLRVFISGKEVFNEINIAPITEWSPRSSSLAQVNRTTIIEFEGYPSDSRTRSIFLDDIRLMCCDPQVETNLFARYPFSTAARFQDSEHNARDLSDSTSGNSTTFASDCAWIGSECAVFQGYNYLSAPTLNLFGRSQLSGFSVCVWFQYGALQAWSQVFDFFAGTNTATTDQLSLGIESTTSTLWTAIRNNSISNTYVWMSPVSLNAWEHICIVNSKSTWKFYRGGRLESTQIFAAVRNISFTRNFIGKSPAAGSLPLVGKVTTHPCMTPMSATFMLFDPVGAILALAVSRVGFTPSPVLWDHGVMCLDQLSREGVANICAQLVPLALRLWQPPRLKLVSSAPLDRGVTIQVRAVVQHCAQ